MARPKKVGLEYFPLDCQMDDKILMLEAEHGMEGFGVYIRLLQYCYQMEDGTLDMSIIFRWKTLGKTLGILPDNLRKMVDTMLEIGLFDRKTFEEQQKLTSNGIQKRISRVEGMRQKDRLRKAEGDSEQGKEFSDGKPGISGRKGAQKESKRDTNVSPKGKGKNSSAADAAGEDEPHSLTHQMRTVIEELIPDYYWSAKDGKHAKELAEKLRHSFKSTRKAEATDADVLKSLRLLIESTRSLTAYHQFSSVPALNERYNGIISEIRNPPKNGRHNPVPTHQPSGVLINELT